MPVSIGGVSVAPRPPPSEGRLHELVEKLLVELGEDIHREGLAETPDRVARSLRYLTEGYGMDARDAVSGALFDEDYDEVVVVRNIPLFSLCEHHLLPIIGVAHVAYAPAGRVVGLSKIPRLVDVYAHRLQLQERLTRQVAEGLNEVTSPHGVAVVIEARHLCLEMRGVEKTGSQTVTSCLLGCFRDDARSRAEVLHLMHSTG
jgi:GTP cyclohydrolase I